MLFDSSNFTQTRTVMNGSKLTAVGFVTAIVLGAVIGGSFAPEWAGYIALGGVLLLPSIICKISISQLRSQLPKMLKMAFGGISPWLWGIVILSIAGSVILAINDTEASTIHELVTPILQSIVAAFIFYVIDVNYSRNQKQKNAYELSNKFLKNIVGHAKLLIRGLGEIHEKPATICNISENEKLSWKPEFSQYFSILDGSKESRYLAYDTTITPHKMCNTSELLWRHYQSIQINILKSIRWHGSEIGNEYVRVLMKIDSCYLMQEYIPQKCDPTSPYYLDPMKSTLCIPQYFQEYILLCQKLEELLDQPVMDN
ncbi:hypothetical protein SAMN02745127_02243 [Oceanospirillum multiglobuliferum]|uniref:Uncharacterized protein n=1 Tax=Oceanospirillum multiglobuliferum TaxID=64969 RepID=A0A1T4RAQ8_9GAMM|nr:hypothetical protein [Oceanospirillum multiglobuliferum]OPX55140.1 hypothetical protein BTE48_10265 [Oceanospirillum multiglobuliferum]SKA12768.1 hypothetical protein SAMN02745127_02243 [Oceanospirillum multiglobuliferum]